MSIERSRDWESVIWDRAERSRPASRVRSLHGVQHGAAGIEVQRIAELVRLGRGDGLDAGGVVARVVAAEAALAERAEQIAQRAIAEKIEALVGHLEARRRRVGTEAAAGAAATGAARFSGSRSGAGEMNPSCIIRSMMSWISFSSFDRASA